MIRAVVLDIDINLKGFSVQLQRLGILHRIVEESGKQVVEVNSETEAALVRQALAEWQRQDPGFDAMPIPGHQDSVKHGTAQQWLSRGVRALSSCPTTWLLMLASLVVAVISELGADTYAVRSLFFPLLPVSSLWALLGAMDTPAEIIRSLTPMLLHFGELHLVFNLLWLWYFGKQLEALQPKWLFLLLVLATSFVSNTTQYLALEYNNFGGMSGVVYGLVGYTWVIHFFMPRSHLLINNSMFVFFVIALVLMEVFASSWIATAAHVGGLVTGLVIGFIVVLYYRLVLDKSAIGNIQS